MRIESKKIYDEIVKNLTEQGVDDENFRKALESVDYRINMETELDQRDAIEDSLEATYKLAQYVEEVTGESFQNILDGYNTTDPDALGDETCRMFVDICNAHEGEEAYDYFCGTEMYSDIVDYLAEDKAEGSDEVLNESSENPGGVVEFRFMYKYWGRDGVGRDKMSIYAPDLRTALFLYGFNLACDLDELENLGVDDSIMNDILRDIYRGKSLKKNIAESVDWDAVSALMDAWGKDPATEIENFLQNDAEGGGDSMAVKVRQGSKEVFSYDVDGDDDF